MLLCQPLYHTIAKQKAPLLRKLFDVDAPVSRILYRPFCKGRRQPFIWDPPCDGPRAALPYSIATVWARPCTGVRILPFHSHSRDSSLFAPRGSLRTGVTRYLSALLAQSRCSDFPLVLRPAVVWGVLKLYHISSHYATFSGFFSSPFAWARTSTS